MKTLQDIDLTAKVDRDLQIIIRGGRPGSIRRVGKQLINLAMNKIKEKAGVL